MSYQVLARQWRPRTFADVVGQQHVLEALSNALRHQRLHHAYLLSGTRGVGKTTIARILSRSLNCVTGITPEPCGTCEACTQIDEGRFVDLLEIDAASRTKVEDTREILENVQYRPTSGRYKVYLIDEVHMLSRHSFNALLKTLEEPPPHAIFLLATTDPDKLPVTVLSRCLQFNLRALTREEIAGQLTKILTAEQIPFEPPALELLARAARGSMRDALSLTDQAIAQGDQAVGESSVARMLGSLDPRDNMALLSYLVKGDTSRTLAHLRGLPDRMTDISDVLSELQNLLHQIALAQVAPDYTDSALVAHQESFKALAEAIAPEQVQVWYRIVLEGRRELPYVTDAFAGVEMTLLRLLSFRPLASTSVPSTSVSAPVASAPTAAVPDAGEAPATHPNPSANPTSADDSDGPDDEISTQAIMAEQAQVLAQAEVMRQAPATPAPSAMPETRPQPSAPMPAATDDPLSSLLATRDVLIQQTASEPGKPAAKQEPPASQAPSTHQGPPARPKIEPTPAPEVRASEPVALQQGGPLTISDDVKVAADVDAWSASIAGLGVQGLARQLLLHSVLAQQGEGYVLTIDMQQQTLATEQTESHLRQELMTLIGDAPLRVEFGQPEQTPFVIQQQIDRYRLQRAESRIMADPRIQQLMKELSAEVKPGTIQPED
ncbi:MAG: DNA polymerase III subunit gamma/tau [Idiomarina sp.]|nr:DNA polymerase III subunit gamma/tau [Idiomarina sp.]